MSALHPTRRSLLSGIAVGMVGALAGCAGESSSTAEREVGGPYAGLPPDATREFEVRSLRAPISEPFVHVRDETPDQTEATDQGDTKAPRLRGRFLIHDAEQANALRFEVDHEDAQSVRSFVEATDFETASVVLYQRSIEECYERHVEYVTVEPDRYFVQFCRRLRDATTRCAADQTVMDAQLIRIPRAYDEPPTSHGSGERSGCHGRPLAGTDR